MQMPVPFDQAGFFIVWNKEDYKTTYYYVKPSTLLRD